MPFIRLFSIVLTLAVFAAPAAVAQSKAVPDGITLVEAYEKDETAEVSIPYEKFVLDNGMTVILHHDDSDPVVHVDLTYSVGSAREEPGRSGFAHFFEHMMFQGSKHVGDEEHIRIITEAGGEINGTTSSDRTNYWQTVPSNQLEKVLWLEADRMGFLLEAVTQEKFEIQRDTVKNERAQNYDNVQYGLTEEVLNEAFFPEGHPYSWPTIGYVEDLDRVNVNDLKAFFLRWYGPNNATLVIAGDFNRAQTLKWLTQYFGPVPRGPEVEKPEKPIVTLDADRYVTLEDNDVSIPLIQISWPTVYVRHPDEAPLDVLMFIMGVGDTSLIYQNLVKSNYAIAASAEHPCEELACKYSVYAMPNPNSPSSLPVLETLINQTFAEFEQSEMNDDDFERTKVEIISRSIFGLESVHGKASQLSYFETYYGDPSLVSRDIERYENVTKADVKRVYETYIKNKPSVTISVVPRGVREMAAREPNWTRPERTLIAETNTTEDDLELRPVKDTFDRSVQPSAGPAPIVQMPELWSATLSNGIEVLGTVTDEVPTTAMALYMKGGQRQESLDKLGTAMVTAAMMNEATQLSTAEQLSSRLQLTGSSVDFGANDEYSSIFVRSLTDHLDETLEIAAEKLLYPKFGSDDFNRIQNSLLQRVDGIKTSTSSMSNNVLRQKLFGPENNFTFSDIGTADTLDNLTLADVQSYYAANYSPKVASIVIVSDLPKSEVLPRLEAFAKWDGPEVIIKAPKPFPELDTGKVYFINKDVAEQSTILVGRRALPFDATGDYYRANLANYNLGEAFNSRVNLKLREELAYTYGAFSEFDGDSEWGMFRALANVRADVTGPALLALITEIRNFHDRGLTDEDLDVIRNAIGQSDALSYETPYQKMGFIGAIQTYGLDEDFTTEQLDILKSISKAELNAIITEYLDPDDMIYIVSGERDMVMPQLESLGYPIEEVDYMGNAYSVPAGGGTNVRQILDLLREQAKAQSGTELEPVD